MTFRRRRPNPVRAALADITAKLAAVDRKVTTIMALVQVEQTDLDALATTLGDIGTNLAAEIANLKTALPTADLSKIDAQVAALQALEVPAPPAPTP